MREKSTKSIRPAGVIVDRRPQSSVVIQMHYRIRSARGKFVEQKSRSLTIQNLTLEEVEARIREAFRTG